jgi:hypothetical protein
LYITIGLDDVFQILPQTTPEEPDSYVEEYACRDENSQKDIQPTMVGWTLVGLGGKYRIIVHEAQYLGVLGVVQVVDDCIHLLADFSDGIIRLIVCENVVIVRGAA